MGYERNGFPPFMMQPMIHDPLTCETCQQIRQLEIERLERRRAFYAAATKERRCWPRFQAWLAQWAN